MQYKSLGKIHNLLQRDRWLAFARAVALRYKKHITAKRSSR